MKQDEVILVGLGVLLFWLYRSTQTSVTLSQTCVFPDDTEVLVPLGSECPYDDAHGGQSVIVEA